MRIGLDFDNTIISYDDVIWRAAQERGLVAPNLCGSKQQVRDIVRELPNGEIKWQALQGYVYGRGIEVRSWFPECRNSYTDRRHMETPS